MNTKTLKILDNIDNNQQANQKILVDNIDNNQQAHKKIVNKFYNNQ